MKNLFLLTLLMATAYMAHTQTTGYLASQKDVDGVEYNYVGELKNSKPNGMGIAIYKPGATINARKYCGQFVDGVFSGKGTLLFKDSVFVTGIWKNGKLEGKGASVNFGGSFYLGNFGMGKKNGEGITIYKDKGLLKGSYVNDEFSGRCVFIGAEGIVYTENMYVGGKKNGSGFQYETANKKLFEGEWKNGDWVQAGAATFNSIAKEAGFTMDKSDEHLMYGIVNAEGYLNGPGYSQDYKTRKREYGVFEKGYIADGVIITDSSVVYGKFDDNGATGICNVYKINNYYNEGIYVNDKMNGDGMSIDLRLGTVYYGNLVNGKFTGSAYYFNKFNEMIHGNYAGGKLYGDGYYLYSNGRKITGTWSDGISTDVKTITAPDNTVYNGTPKDMSEALGIVAADFQHDFNNIGGWEIDDEWSWDDLLADDVTKPKMYDTFLYFPGSIADTLFQDFFLTNYYTATLMKKGTYAQAKDAYAYAAKQLLASTINGKEIGMPFKISGTIAPPTPDAALTQSILRAPKENKNFEYFNVWLQMEKDVYGSYTVRLQMGEKED